MFLHQDRTTDPLAAIVTLAARHGLTPSVLALVDGRTQAGTLMAPPRDSSDLIADEIVAAKTVVSQFAWLSTYRSNGTCCFPTAYRRLQMVAAVALLVLPGVVWDYEGRFSVTLDDKGFLPEAPAVEARVIFHVRRLEEYLKDSAAGEWVDPNALAGEVANVHDAARMLVTVMEIDGLSG